MRFTHYALAGTLAFATTTASAAYVELYYPAATCIGEDATSAAKLHYTQGRISASGGGTATVYCALSATPGGAAAQASSTLYYVDKSNSDMTCTHYWTSSTGGDAWSQTFTSSGNSTTLKGFTATLGSGNPGDVGLGYPKTWRCTLPANGNIYITGHLFTSY